jgi:hypothetical protein
MRPLVTKKVPNALLSALNNKLVGLQENISETNINNFQRIQNER